MRPPADHPLAPYGWTAEVAARYEAPVRAAFAAGRAEPGRVVRVERGFDTVRVAGGELLVARAHPEFRAAGLRGAAGPVVGDWAAVSSGPEPAVVALAPRRGCLSRRDPRARAVEQPVAANVDVVVIAAPLDRAFNPRRLERALVLVHEAGADPLVALTKSDLADPTAVEDALAAAEALAGAGRARAVSAAADAPAGRRPAHALGPELGAGRTAVVVGPSGAGKSSIVNELVGAEVAGTAEVRAHDAKGRHTTTSRQLFPLATGGVIIDTPGVRALGLWNAEDGLDQAFADIEALARSCRFADCGHRAEPGCAVAAALADGSLDPARYASHQALGRELADLRARQEAQRRKAGEGRRYPGRSRRRR